jgi:hypothetical protein
MSPVSVGNGNLTYTADITGFQNFDPGETGAIGTVPLCTMVQWGFHTYPNQVPRDDDYDQLRRAEFSTGDRTVGYMSDPNGQEERFNRLRVSPHRANLARIRLVDATYRSGGAPITRDACSSFRQRLDLWEGALDSSFVYRDNPIQTSVVCDPEHDALAFTVQVASDSSWQPAVEISFPYPSHTISGSDWSSERTDAHETVLIPGDTPTQYTVVRRIDDLVFLCVLRVSVGSRVHLNGAHQCRIESSTATLGVTVEFVRSRRPEEIPTGSAPDWDRCRHDAADYWQQFWSSGPFLDLGDSQDPRARELERRIVLSRYLTAIQCAGSFPPAETGLTCNSWYGKFHLEMHPWHALHFPLWGQPAALYRSLDYYREIAETARARAAEQGYRGLRWPKMTSPDGSDSPSEIGTLLCWQQPHFIVMVATLYRIAERGMPTGAGGPTREELVDRYRDLVFDSADFMADYAVRGEDGWYHLGPPVIPAQENHPPKATRDPTFELEYWRLGLSIAAEWKRRRGEPIPKRWTDVQSGLAPPPIDERTGGYAAHARCTETYGAYAHDHPAMLIAYSYFAGEEIDSDVMARSLDAVREHWDFDSAWGWDFPVMAMCAARLGRRNEAVNYLLMAADKNTFRPNGHNAQLPKRDLPLYLPGNGALLLAIALMAGGWPGSAGVHPGFPDDGTWSVRSEGFRPVVF